MCERFKHFGEKDWKSATMLTHFSFLKGRKKREKYKLCKLTYLSNRAIYGTIKEIKPVKLGIKMCL